MFLNDSRKLDKQSPRPMASLLRAQGLSGMSGHRVAGRDRSLISTPETRDPNESPHASQLGTQQNNPQPSPKKYIEDIIQAAFAADQLSDDPKIQDLTRTIKDAAFRLLSITPDTTAPSLELSTVLQGIQDIQKTLQQTPSQPRSWAHIASHPPSSTLSSYSSAASLPKLTIQLSEEECLYV